RRAGGWTGALASGHYPPSSPRPGRAATHPQSHRRTHVTDRDSNGQELTDAERKAVLGVCMMAAFADGSVDREREEIRRIAEGLGRESGLDLAGMYQDVLLRRVGVADVVAALQSPRARRVAWEMAVCVCDADGAQS